MVIKCPQAEFLLRKGYEFKYFLYQNVLQTYRENLHLKTNMQVLDNDYLEDELRAFINALWFFSSDFYNKLPPTDPQPKDIFSKHGYLLEKAEEWGKYPSFKEVVANWDYSLLTVTDINQQKMMYKQRVLIKFMRTLMYNEKVDKECSLAKIGDHYLYLYLQDRFVR